jgi:hypothetical protein
MLRDFKYLIFTWIHMLIPIQTNDNQILNDNIITFHWWLHGTNSKECLKIYKKYDHGTINKLKYTISTQWVVAVHNTDH